MENAIKQLDNNLFRICVTFLIFKTFVYAKLKQK